jgi:tripartite-type tricarboxylate transporter receptor subunit TctC
MGVFAPKETPAPVVTALNTALGSALNDGTVQTRLRDASATVVAPERRSSEYLTSYLASEIAKWAAIMKASKVPQQ